MHSRNISLQRGAALCLGALLVCASVAWPQTTSSGDLVVLVEGHINTMPGASSTNKYIAPADSEFAQWSTAASFILQGLYHEADSCASLIGYQVILFSDITTVPSHEYAVLAEVAGHNHFWGLFVFNTEPIRPDLAIQSPHPLNDSNTGRQAIRMFKNLGAAAFMISGAHRCNNPEFSPCSGTTTSCNSSGEPYRISDQPHSAVGTFQATTMVLSSFFPEMVFVQVHGFAKLAGDPDLIMSYGTSAAPAGEDKLVMLRDNFALEDATLTFKVAHVDLGWIRLIATQNTQGRFLNGAADPCNDYASASSGHFIHVEQAMPKLRDTEANWNKFSNALANTFTPVSSVSGPPGVAVLPRAHHLHENYPNPFNPSTTISYTLGFQEQIHLEVRNVLGQRVAVLADGIEGAGTHSVIFDASDLPSGVYYVTLRFLSGSETRSMLLVR
jgi:hypothetical protein